MSAATAALVDLIATEVIAKLRASGELGASTGSPLTVEELAAKLRVSTDVIYSRVRSGQIAQVPEVGRVLIPFNESQRLLEGRAS